MKNAVTLSHAESLSVKEAFDLEDQYADYLESLVSDDRQGIFHPSAVGMCARKNVYEFTRAPQDRGSIPGDLQEIFDMGHAVHEIVQTRMEKMGVRMARRGISFKFSKEVRYDPFTDYLYLNYGIGGTTDGIIEVEQKGACQRGILEIKSIGDDGWQKLTGAKEDHLDQATLYAFRYNCPIIWIWYYNKNTSKRRVFPYVYDPARLLRILEERYAIWLQHALDGTLPEREESYFGCKDCSYHQICKPSIRRKGSSNKAALLPPKALLRKNRPNAYPQSQKEGHS